MEILLQLITSGIAMGMIYSVIAFGFQLTFATSRTLNFTQGDATMLGALLGVTLSRYLPYPLLIPFVLFAGAAQGMIVERFAIQPSLKAKTQFSWIMGTMALGIICKNVAELIWGRDDLPFPSPLPVSPIRIFNTFNVLPMELAVIGSALIMMVSIEVFNRKSIYGKAFVATSNDPDAAGLVGINTKRMITFSYALSSLTGAFAGTLIAPLTAAGPYMGSLLVLKAFAVAIVGGLNSGLGIIFGGLLLGVAESTTAFYVSTGYKEVPGLLLLLLVLIVRPQGLFNKTAVGKV